VQISYLRFMPIASCAFPREGRPRGGPVRMSTRWRPAAEINATGDADGIARLKQMLDKYEEILKLLQ
jgi:hypothetical protein